MSDAPRGNKHLCIAEDCAVLVPRSQLCCKPHWFDLPAGLRSRIWREYRAEPLGTGHVAAMAEARRFLTLENLGTVR